MPKYNLFNKLPFLSYIDKIHVRYTPGSPYDDTCRKLLLMLLNPDTLKKFPGLNYTYELLNYHDRPEIHITMKPNVNLRFYADSNTLEDIHRQIDVYQYNAHIRYTQHRSLEGRGDDDS
ncbi:conserved hypothetical protein [Theileria orientalis strain Shintoku]|uniref:Uncharacterized protein n=1 Tax=Theileria orientalis strain Shintoku TaxID=869250 RepID=J4DP45_THEOR|nr:conserved hypothetical protein [Theileria orientalis strain Shintoku]PVC51165.1 hypothetical protein MACL_00001768 [Theileria orientalis]BAM40069.1 conserved hypothetical protein [Theileria orientalis strain Shintoku]|eukprot:XP_009690370.1 conserved hypothetical protein [Theileria orientalis strain Shintoku]